MPFSQTQRMQKTEETKDMVPKGSATTIRQDMAFKGWQSEDRLTSFGFGQDEMGNPEWGYSIWFYRWDWHGRKCEKVSFCSETDDISEIQSSVKKAAKKALEAWNTNPNFPPNQQDLKNA
jgi:hypothetical protein